MLNAGATVGAGYGLDHSMYSAARPTDATWVWCGLLLAQCSLLSLLALFANIPASRKFLFCIGGVALIASNSSPLFLDISELALGYIVAHFTVAYVATGAVEAFKRAPCEEPPDVAPRITIRSSMRAIAVLAFVLATRQVYPENGMQPPFYALAICILFALAPVPLLWANQGKTRAYGRIGVAFCVSMCICAYAAFFGRPTIVNLRKLVILSIAYNCVLYGTIAVFFRQDELVGDEEGN